MSGRPVTSFVRRSESGQRRRLGFIGAMGLTTLLTTVHATWTDFGAVFSAMADANRVPDPLFHRVLMEGLKESTRPGSFGGFILTLSALLVAVGILRANRRDD
jgi:hypothetical protein